jgi:hypothetical protein
MTLAFTTSRRFVPTLSRRNRLLHQAYGMARNVKEPLTGGCGQSVENKWLDWKWQGRLPTVPQLFLLCFGCNFGKFGRPNIPMVFVLKTLSLAHHRNIETR